jgi:hypothetical protein
MAGNANDSMDDDYRIGTVEPLQEILEAEIRRTIFGDNGFGELIAGWKWELEGRTQEDEQSEHDRIHDDVEKGLLTPNQARKKKGEDEVADPALDRHYYQGKPISTDPAITEVHQTLAELRDALTAAAGAGDSGLAKRRRGVFRIRQAE